MCEVCVRWKWGVEKGKEVNSILGLRIWVTDERKMLSGARM